MQAYLFMQAIDLIVQFGEDPGHFFLQLKPLVIRHIKYGVKTEVSLAFSRLCCLRLTPRLFRVRSTCVPLVQQYCMASRKLWGKPPTCLARACCLRLEKNVECSLVFFNP